MNRASKGSVVVCPYRGRLRLQFPRHVYGGKQRYMALNLPDTPEYRLLAEAKAKQIEADIAFERFDPTLAAYRKTYEPPAPKSQSPLIADLWADYTTIRVPHLSPNTLKDFDRIRGHVARLDGQRATATAGKKLRSYCEGLPQDTARRLIMYLFACCEWAIAEGRIDTNPFEGMQMKRQSHNKIDPFTVEERDMILLAFEQHPHHRHYYAYTAFRFYTGCRPGEAAGLLWSHIDPGIRHITFCETLTEAKKRKVSTKTGDLRRFPVNEQLRAVLLMVLKREPWESVFVSPQGGEINTHNYCTRIWKPIVKELPIRYRPPYAARHTFATLCLERGEPTQRVAAWLGCSADVVNRHYAGLTRSEVPEL